MNLVQVESYGTTVVGTKMGSKDLTVEGLLWYTKYRNVDSSSVS